MLFCIDIGNINIVFFVWDGSRFLVMWWILIDYWCMVDEYFVWLLILMLV